MWSTPLQQPTVSSQHSLCDPKPKLTQVKAVNRKGWKGITPIPFLNPDPEAQLVGHANEMPVVIDGCEVTALIDFGAQVSNISAQLCEDQGLEIQSLGWLLGLEGTGDAAIPYLRFVEVNLQILGIRGYNKDVLLLAIPTMAYTEGVPVMVGFKNYRYGSKLHDCRGACTCNCHLVTSSLWSSHIWITADIPQQLRENKA